MINTEPTTLPFFSPILPWQINLWKKLTTASIEQKPIPHAILASGMSGIGKRHFIWRWVAWQLCDHRSQSNHQLVACGHCESCVWLKAGTHPDLQILPLSSVPTYNDNEINQDHTKKNKTASKTVPKIKVDDIRDIQTFVQQSSSHMRICIFDHAETMTTAAANALLKTLEEPQPRVQLILITDHPSLLLPTISSRLQKLPFTIIDSKESQQYVSEHLNQQDLTADQIEQLLRLSSNSPIQAVKLANSKWYPLRNLWLTTWLAVRTGKRSAILASDYWQNQLNLDEFIQLTQLMMSELQRLSSNIPLYQQDIDFDSISKQNIPNISDIHKVTIVLQEIKHSIKQNVQEKLAYDMLMESLAGM